MRSKWPGLQIATKDFQNLAVQQTSIKEINNNNNNQKKISEKSQQDNVLAVDINVHIKITFGALAFRPLSRPLIILINLLWLDMLLICDAAGEGIEPVIGVMLSKVLSGGCFIIFSFFALCCAYRPSEQDSWMCKNKNCVYSREKL